MPKYYSIAGYANKLGMTEKSVYDKLKGRKLSSFAIGNDRFIIDPDSNNEPIKIALTNLKGGSGKTTSIVNIAALLAKLNQRVLIIDCDSQSHVKYFFKVPEGDHRTIRHLLLDDLPIKECITSTEIPTLDVVLGDIILTLQEKQIFDQHLLLKERIQDVERNYDFILFDNPPAMNTYSINSILASDFVLIPAQANFLGFEGITHLIEAVNQITQDFPIEILGIFLTVVEQQLNQSKFFSDTIRDTYGNLFLEGVIRKDVRISESCNFGMNIFDYKEKSRGAQDYKKLTVELLHKLEATYE